MSTSKLDRSGVFQPIIIQTPKAKFKLLPNAVRIRKNGIEFLSPASMPIWTEMTVTLHSPGDTQRVECTGVVVESNGNRHSGYVVSVFFLNLSPRSEEQLHLLAYSQAGAV